jgi:hypothetical protein
MLNGRVSVSRYNNNDNTCFIQFRPKQLKASPIQEWRRVPSLTLTTGVTAALAGSIRYRISGGQSTRIVGSKYIASKRCLYS